MKNPFYNEDFNEEDFENDLFWNRLTNEQLIDEYKVNFLLFDKSDDYAEIFLKIQKEILRRMKK